MPCGDAEVAEWVALQPPVSPTQPLRSTPPNRFSPPLSDL